MSDIQRISKDKSTEVKAEKTAKDIDIFGNNVLLLYLSKKTERLTSAVYILTDSFLSSEPLKTHLRSVCLRLVSDFAELLSLRDSVTALPKNLSTVGEILMLLAVSARVRLISDENVKVLEEEYRKLAQLLIDRVPRHLNGPHFTPSDFEIKTRVFQDTVEAGTAMEPRRSIFADRGGSGRQDRTSDYGVSKDAHVARATDRGVRRAQILSEIARKGKVTIRDVSAVVKGHSEKTIQRELASLVFEGVLKREGERRWSTYQLT